jgi:uncharacterized protein with PQ loop repeat
MMIEAIGWLGSILFALCAVPQAYQSWKNKHSNGLSWGFLLMWFFGEILMIIYVTQMEDENVLPLLANYYFNLLLLVVIIWYRAFPASSKVDERGRCQA